MLFAVNAYLVVLSKNILIKFVLSIKKSNWHKEFKQLSLEKLGNFYEDI